MSASENQILVCQSNAGKRGEVIENVVLFTKPRKDLKVAGVTSQHFKRNLPHRVISDTDIETFNAHCPQQDIRYCKTIHDRFLIVYDKELYCIVVSLKDFGKKCFAFAKLNAEAISGITKAAFTYFSYRGSKVPAMNASNAFMDMQGKAMAFCYKKLWHQLIEHDSSHRFAQCYWDGPSNPRKVVDERGCRHPMLEKFFACCNATLETS